jgi:hypothetical protein
MQTGLSMVSRVGAESFCKAVDSFRVRSATLCQYLSLLRNNCSRVLLQRDFFEQPVKKFPDALDMLRCTPHFCSASWPSRRDVMPSLGVSSLDLSRLTFGLNGFFLI